MWEHSAHSGNHQHAKEFGLHALAAYVAALVFCHSVFGTLFARHFCTVAVLVFDLRIAGFAAAEVNARPVIPATFDALMRGQASTGLGQYKVEALGCRPSAGSTARLLEEWNVRLGLVGEVGGWLVASKCLYGFLARVILVLAHHGQGRGVAAALELVHVRARAAALVELNTEEKEL